MKKKKQIQQGFRWITSIFRTENKNCQKTTEHTIHGSLKGRMILRCVEKAISYKCPYVIAIVVPDLIYTVVMMTICANQENNIV